MKGISVIICCYNSALRLPQTLHHLAQQEVPIELPWEVILVNNGSTDNTEEVAVTTWSTYTSLAEFKIVNEPEPGLSSARSRGVATAKYEVFIFCDDDNWLAPDFVRFAYETMIVNPKVGAACGTGVPATDSIFPDWFERYAGGYAVGRPAANSGDVSHLRALTGAGLVSRKSLFEKVYATYPALLSDRKGIAMTSGGDSEYTMRLVLMGYQLYFDDRLTFTHFIPAFRLTETYRDNLFKGFRTATPVLELYLFQIKVKTNTIAANLFFLMKCLVRWVILKIVRVQRWNIAREVNWIFQLTGWTLGPVTEECKMVRAFYKHYQAA